MKRNDTRGCVGCAWILLGIGIFLGYVTLQHKYRSKVDRQPPALAEIAPTPKPFPTPEYVWEKEEIDDLRESYIKPRLLRKLGFTAERTAAFQDLRITRITPVRNVPETFIATIWYHLRTDSGGLLPQQENVKVERLVNRSRFGGRFGVTVEGAEDYSPKW